MFTIFESGCAVERLTRARQFLTGLSPATEVVVISSTRAAADDLVREVAAQTGATAGLYRFSLTQLASRIATAVMAIRGIAPLTAVGADAIAARATFESLRRHELEYFAPLADRPGFSKALAATIRELHASRVAPPELAQLGARGRDLARLLMEYGRQSSDARLADATQFVEIAASVVEAEGTELEGKPVLLIDLAIHSQAERRLVSALVAKSPLALATVIAGDDRTASALRSFTSEYHTDPPRFSTSLERLQNFVFETLPDQSYAEDGCVHYFSAPGEGRECVEIGRRIQEQARQGVPFDRIAVVVRSPQTYYVLLQAALERAGVPAYFARGSSRPDPSGRAFLVLLSCAEEGLSAKRFAEYLSLAQVPELQGGAPPSDRDIWVSASNELVAESVAAAVNTEPQSVPMPEYVDEGDPLAAGSLRAPWKWEELLVEAAVIGGRDRWERRLAGLAAELGLRVEALRSEEPESPRITSLQRQLRDLEHLRRFAMPTIAALADLPQRATWGEWLRALELLAPRVLRSPERVLSVLAELRPMTDVGPVGLVEVREALSAQLLDLNVEPPRSRFGRVFVTPPEQLRGRSFAVVFVPGLAERVFPQKLREDPLLLDEYRQQLKGSDPPLLTRADRAAEERLRLRIAAGAAESRIYFSYPRVEVALGRPRVPSFYALDVRRTTLGTLPNVDQFERDAARNGGAELAWLAPKNPDNAIDDVEHDLAMLRPLLLADPRSVRGQGRYLLELSPELGRSLRTRWQRWRKRWSSSDGLCDSDESTRAVLARYRPTTRAYSPTALQNFAACPYKFALASIYRLETREEPVPLQMLDPLTRGSMYHAAVARFFRRAMTKNALPVTPKNLQQRQEECDAILNEVAAEWHELLAPAIERVWKDEVEALRADLRGWLAQQADHPDGFVPLLIEFGFGLSRDGGRDPESVSGPAQLQSGFLLHGIVDLVEQNPHAGKLRVTDHKTGKNRTEDGMIVGGGEVLQPVLYSLALEALRGHAIDEARLSFCTAVGAYEERTVLINDAARKAAISVLRVIDNAVEGAFLPPAPKENGCDWCDFRAVCGPHEELRASHKDPAPLAALLKLRGMP